MVEEQAKSEEYDFGFEDSTEEVKEDNARSTVVSDINQNELLDEINKAIESSVESELYKADAQPV